MHHASIRFIGFAVSVPVRPAAERKRGFRAITDPSRLYYVSR
jgi:hypothetical protein